MSEKEYWVKQRNFDDLYYKLNDPNDYETITRKEYVEEIDNLWSSINPKDRPSLQRRKDRRTLGEFALQVYDCSVREKFLITEWLKCIGREDVSVTDYGIANDGRLVLDVAAESAKPDYYLNSDKGDFKLELKFCPVQYKATFKVCDLKNYVKEDALVLLVMGETKMIGPNGDPYSEKPLVVPNNLKWCLFGKDTIMQILKELPIKLHKEVGGKPSVQLRDGVLNRFLKPKEWNYEIANLDVQLAY